MEPFNYSEQDLKMIQKYGMSVRFDWVWLYWRMTGKNIK